MVINPSITVFGFRLAYLHEAIEPKVIHRDIKSSNILIDDEFNAKVSDFGLAKLLDSGESYITTRVMGTFGYTENFIILSLVLKGFILLETHFCCGLQLCGTRIRQQRFVK